MNALRKVSRIAGFVSGILILIIWVLMVAEVFMRNVFVKPILGVSEICVFLYVSASYFGFSFAQLNKSHISVDLLYSNMKPAVQKIMERASFIICDVLFVMFSYCSWKSFAISFAKREIYLAAMRMPVYVLRFAIAIGVTIMLLQMIVDTIEVFKNKAALPEASGEKEVK